MSFAAEEVLEEFASVARSPRERWWHHLRFDGARVWNRETELARCRAKYLREMATPEGIERHRGWSRDTYRRAMASEEGRRRAAEKSNAYYHRMKNDVAWLAKRRRRHAESERRRRLAREAAP